MLFTVAAENLSVSVAVFRSARGCLFDSAVRLTSFILTPVNVKQGLAALLQPASYFEID